MASPNIICHSPCSSWYVGVSYISSMRSFSFVTGPLTNEIISPLCSMTRKCSGEVCRRHLKLSSLAASVAGKQRASKAVMAWRSAMVARRMVVMVFVWGVWILRGCMIRLSTL